jgi:hypothetical protein
MRMLMTRTRWSWLRTESISGWMPEPFAIEGLREPISLRM